MNFLSAYVWMLVFVRAGGLFIMIPVFSGKTIPVQLRVAIAGLLALVMSGFVHAKGGIPADLSALGLAVMHELLIGLVMGAVVRFILFSIEFAGQIMSTEMGLMMSSMLDPLSQASSTPIGIALFYLGSLLFMITDCHQQVFVAFLRSFEIAPLGAVTFDRNIAELFVSSTGKIFLVAVQMAAPLIAVNFIVSFTFAILGKAAPGINVFSESFAVRILAGLAIFGITLGLTAQLVLTSIRQSPELMLRLIP